MFATAPHSVPACSACRSSTPLPKGEGEHRERSAYTATGEARKQEVPGSETLQFNNCMD